MTWKVKKIINCCSSLDGIWTHTIDTLQHHSLSLTFSALNHSTTSIPYIYIFIHFLVLTNDKASMIFFTFHVIQQISTRNEYLYTDCSNEARVHRSDIYMLTCFRPDNICELIYIMTHSETETEEQIWLNFRTKDPVTLYTVLVIFSLGELLTRCVRQNFSLLVSVFQMQWYISLERNQIWKLLFTYSF
jgi:hypothetical protein